MGDSLPPVNMTVKSNPHSAFQEVSGHIEASYTMATGKWTPLKFVTNPYLRIHGMAPALNYGQQVFEGIKAYRISVDCGGITIFRPDRHAIRFQHSAELLSLPPVPVDMFLDACRAAVALNAAHIPSHESGGWLYLRPQLYGTSPQLGLHVPEEFRFCVFAVPTGPLYGTNSLSALILDDFDRTAPKGMGSTKAGGNYAPVFRWSKKAKIEGYNITLHLDSARHEAVDEFSTCGFIGVICNGADDVTLVVPDSPCIVDSVTSQSAQQIGRSFGWKVEKREIRYTELPTFSEVIGAGTSVVLVTIRSITRRKTGKLSNSPRVSVDGDTETVTYLAEGELGPVCQRLLAQLEAIQQGKVADKFGWRYDVRREDANLTTPDQEEGATRTQS